MFTRTALVTLALALGIAAPAAAQSAPFSDCPDYGGDRICTAQVPSFDGAPLDVDLTLPEGGGTSHPLIVLLHGFGNDKREWESTDDRGDGADKLRWNSHWFARHGFYVLTYTARGFRTDGPGETKPPTPSGTSVSLPSGTIQIKSKEVEIRDTQYLASRAADAFPDLDRERVAVSGGSYGGGESWLQAADPVWEDFTSPPLRLQVAVPKYPWTDLGFSLAPNGRGTIAGQRPIGTAKASYITGLFASGNANGAFEEGTRTTPTSEGPINVPAWNTRIVGAGDPYPPEDPVVAQARRGLTEYRSAFYQDWERLPRTAVFSISGWTDDLFEAIESFRMFDRLKAIDPRWPVEVAVADVGHSRAQNKPAQWGRLNDQAWQFLQSNLSGPRDQRTTVSSMPTLCGTANADSTMRLTASSPAGLSSGTLRIAYARGAALDQASGADDPDGARTDAIAGGLVPPGRPNDGCTQSARSPEQQTSGYTALSQPLDKPRTYIGTGAVSAPYALVGPGATLHARVWDVAPDGTALLMTRGTYRFDTLAAGDPDAPAGTVRLPLYGNHWPIEAGHRIRLDLQETDAPTFRPTNIPNQLTLQPPALTLPTRESGTVTLGGG
jgi:dienelactone hydrolase